MLDIGNAILDQLNMLFRKHQGSIRNACNSWRSLCEDLFIDVRNERNRDEESEHPFMTQPDAFLFIEDALSYSYGDKLFLEYPRKIHNITEDVYTKDTKATWMWHIDLDRCELILVVGHTYIQTWPMKYFWRLQSYRFRRMFHTMFVQNACAIIVQTWWRRCRHQRFLRVVQDEDDEDNEGFHLVEQEEAVLAEEDEEYYRQFIIV